MLLMAEFSILLEMSSRVVVESAWVLTLTVPEHLAELDCSELESSELYV